MEPLDLGAVDSKFAELQEAAVMSKTIAKPRDDGYARRAAAVKAREQALLDRRAEELRVRRAAERVERENYAALTATPAQLLLRAGRGWVGAPSTASDFSELEVHRLLSEDQGGFKGNVKLNEVRGLGGLTPLHRAADSGNDSMVRTLLRAGADVNARTVFGATALHKASHRGDSVMIRSLLDAGADIDAADGEGFTPLLRAVHYGDHFTAQVLLDAGADVDLVVHPPAALSGTGSGVLTAMDLAREGGSETVVRLVEQRQAINPHSL